jgi:rhamnulokinase
MSAPRSRDTRSPQEGSRAKVEKNSNLVAIDLGAMSCRVSLLQWAEDQPKIRSIHRFANAPLNENGHLFWDLPHICQQVENGLRACASGAPEGIASIGIDGWAVDYVRLNRDGLPAGNPFCYRDERTIAAQKEVHARISQERLYELTGIQVLPLNTLYQLRVDGPKDHSPWLNLPEYMLHYLGGRRVSEYTNATHTQLLDTRNAWCKEIFSAAEIDPATAPVLVMPGTDVGKMHGPLASLKAFSKTKLIAPACHDTASAIAGIFAEDDSCDSAFISSGTWSLVGRVLDAPCISVAAQRANFSNEGGVGGKINFLKNVNGMWVVQQCIEAWQAQGHTWTLDSLISESSSLPRPKHLLDFNHADLLLPGNMPERIHKHFVNRNLPSISQEASQSPVVANLIFHSLAAHYAAVLSDLAQITGHPVKRIYIVGGGSKNVRLNRLTEQATGLPVLRGSAESATVGNFAIQLATQAADYTEQTGVSSSAVAYWARILNQQRFTAIRE